GMSRCTQGGQAVRAVALLPGVVGAYAKRGGGALLMTAAGFGFDSSAIPKPPGPAAPRPVDPPPPGGAPPTLDGPTNRPPVRGRQQSRGDVSGRGGGAARARA